MYALAPESIRASATSPRRILSGLSRTLSGSSLSKGAISTSGKMDRVLAVLQAGDQAPDFELRDQNGDPIKLSDLKGQTLVLYFYPRADTPGCTTQACGVRDRRAEYEAAGARVIGISPDSVDAEKKFADKFDLDFTLLADADHAVAERYGTWVEKSMYGKKYMGVQRATFIVGPDGKVAQVFPKVSPKTHDDVVLKALDELTAA